MNDVSDGKCGGGWYDPIDTQPATFLEQARQTIIGGARESLLHCYDYLATKTPGLAVHNCDLDIANGFADAAAFKNEVSSLQVLADTLCDMNPYGVLLPKKPNDDPACEQYLPSFVGMLGIPVIASASLKTSAASFLGAQAGRFADIASYIATAYEQHRPLVMTAAVLDMIEESSKTLNDGRWKDLLDHCKAAMNQDKTTPLVDISDALSVLRCPADLWDLMKLDQGSLDRMRNNLLIPFDMEFLAPSRVSLHLFKSAGTWCEMVENFNDAPVTVSVRFRGAASSRRGLALSLPQRTSATLARNESDSYALDLAPRSMALLTTKA
jgi:hypothetical protein